MVSMQLYYHDICNQIAERPHANMSQAINDISNLATTQTRVSLLRVKETLMPKLTVQNMNGRIV